MTDGQVADLQHAAISLAQARYARAAARVNSEKGYDDLPLERRRVMLAEAQEDIGSLSGAGFIIISTEALSRMLIETGSQMKAAMIHAMSNFLAMLAQVGVAPEPTTTDAARGKI
jgi:hypothetical protein